MDNPQIIASTPDVSALVAANAGTGKTKVLVDRYIRLLLQGNHPAKILCLTYTKAAANEMRERIMDIIQKWLMCDDIEVIKDLEFITGDVPAQADILTARQLFEIINDSMPLPRIQTIHSFAQEVLSKFPFEAQISPYFETSENIGQLLQHLVFEQVKTSSVFKRVVELISVQQIGKVIANIVEKKSTIKPTTIDDLDICLGNAIWLKDYDANQLAEQFKQQILSIDILPALQGLDPDDDKDISTLANMHTILTADYNEANFLNIFLTQKLTPRKSIFKKALMQQKPQLVELTEGLKHLCADYINHQNLLRDYLIAKDLYELKTIIFKLTEEISNHQHILDYDNLITKLHKLFNSYKADYILHKLDEQIEHVLLDEAQDTTPTQWQIITKIIEEFFSGTTHTNQTNRTIFIVGDDKQSIYSFQGADPEHLSSMDTLLASKAKYVAKQYNKVSLNTSYRSYQGILNFVDKLFAQPEMLTKISKLSNNIKHKAYKGYSNEVVEVLPVTRPNIIDDKTSNKWQLPNIQATQKLHDLHAQNIIQLVQSLINQNHLPRDILILVQKRGDLISSINNQLLSNNIPTAGLDKIQLNHITPLKYLVKMAKVSLYPYDELTKAELGNFGIDTSNIKLKINGIKNIFNQLISQYPFDISEQNLSYLNGFINEFITNNGDNITLFITDFESSKATIKLTNNNKNSVRLMTIHNAKGLQSKVVILADACNYPKKYDEILFDKLGNMFKRPTLNNASTYTQNLRDEHDEKQLNEYYRLLYVALTRAEHSLYITGHAAKKINDKSWYALCQAALNDNITV